MKKISEHISMEDIETLSKNLPMCLCIHLPRHHNTCTQLRGSQTSLNTLHTITKTNYYIIIWLIELFHSLDHYLYKERINACSFWINRSITRMIHKHWPAGFCNSTTWRMNYCKNHQEQNKQLKTLMHGHFYDIIFELEFLSLWALVYFNGEKKKKKRENSLLSCFTLIIVYWRVLAVFIVWGSSRKNVVVK